MKRQQNSASSIRHRSVGVRLSESEVRLVKEKAARAHLSVATYVRKAALGFPLPTNADMVNELRDLASLLKSMHEQGQRTGEREHASVLKAIFDAIGRIAIADAKP